MPGMMRMVRSSFQRIPDPVASRGLTQTDCLMSGLAVFLFKFPSLLEFDKASRLNGEPVVVMNLKRLFKIGRVPSDTSMRERLDRVDPRDLRRPFTRLFAALQRGKVLESFKVLDKYLVISIDGTGYFSSSKIKCKHCCETNHKNGSTTYSHKVLGAVLVHPDHSAVLPLAPEMITRQDGSKKNDCEQNAGKRLIRDLRRAHPKLEAIIVEDGLNSNGPHLKLLQEHDFRFIIGAKPGNHGFLFDKLATSGRTRTVKLEDRETERQYQFRWLNRVPVNDSQLDVEVNFLECRQTDKHGKLSRFSWVTDFTVTEDNAETLMKIARRRWGIENELFRTLKQQNNFEHDFGHGRQHCCGVFAFLAMLAFLIDQIQEHACPLFRAMRKKQGSRRKLWQALRTRIEDFHIEDWDSFYRAVAMGHDPPTLKPKARP